MTTIEEVAREYDTHPAEFTAMLAIGDYAPDDTIEQHGWTEAEIADVVQAIRDTTE